LCGLVDRLLGQPICAECAAAPPPAPSPGQLALDRWREHVGWQGSPESLDRDLCPACAAEAKVLTDDDRGELLRMELGLARRPRALDRKAKADLLLFLFDLIETCHRDGEFAELIQDALATLSRSRS
jgi:hypothetical protein